MQVVSPARFERTASELGILCSILLSYEDTKKGHYSTQKSLHVKGKMEKGGRDRFRGLQKNGVISRFVF